MCLLASWKNSDLIGVLKYACPVPVDAKKVIWSVCDIYLDESPVLGLYSKQGGNLKGCDITPIQHIRTHTHSDMVVEYTNGQQREYKQQYKWCTQIGLHCFIPSTVNSACWMTVINNQNRNEEVKLKDETLKIHEASKRHFMGSQTISEVPGHVLTTASSKYASSTKHTAICFVCIF